MITKTQKVDLDVGLPEKKKKKKKEVVKEPETQYSGVNDKNYFADNSVRTTSHSRTVSQEQMSHIPLLKKKKKKKTGHSNFYEELPESEPTSQARQTEKSPSPRKQKKPVRIEVVEYIPLGDHPKARVKKKTKAKKKEENPVVELAQKRKKKKKKESTVTVDPLEEEPDTDLEVVMEKKGNMDEAHIDQVRRKALQEEIDRESGKTEAFEPRKWTGTQFGQWDTADFENKEQKLKFLKLMGGFKNLSPSVSCSPCMTTRPNMALGKVAADTLQQKLQQDYDRAHSVLKLRTRRLLV
ncbi:lysine-rich nucleolar protein 1 [Octodon degus]|uniref:Lysine-rich nucleolar protein 1 n=1 Tax=Octodon degus TaxID=10160 RepID=A0A6P6DJH8_OCTDE|nr:lysine-rich nucleolar protein 1 [Octodon degus]